MSPLEHELREAWAEYLGSEPATTPLTLYAFVRWLAENRPHLVEPGGSRWAEARVRAFVMARASAAARARGTG